MSSNIQQTGMTENRSNTNVLNNIDYNIRLKKKHVWILKKDNWAIKAVTMMSTYKPVPFCFHTNVYVCHIFTSYEMTRMNDFNLIGPFATRLWLDQGFIEHVCWHFLKIKNCLGIMSSPCNWTHLVIKEALFWFLSEDITFLHGTQLSLTNFRCFGSRKKVSLHLLFSSIFN